MSKFENFPKDESDTKFGECTAKDFNILGNELINTINSANLTPSMNEEDQMAKSIANYVAKGNFYDDVTTDYNHILLSTKNPFKAPNMYYDGMVVIFLSKGNNLTNATINVNGLGDKSIREKISQEGISNGYIKQNEYVQLIFNSALDSFIILKNDNNNNDDNPQEQDLKYITNYLKKVPQTVECYIGSSLAGLQNIKIKKNTNIYIKSGSTYEEKIIEHDYTASILGTGTFIIVYNKNKDNFYSYNQSSQVIASKTQPELDTTRDYLWYDLTNKVIKIKYQNTNEWLIESISMPVCCYIKSLETINGRIDSKIIPFNGFGFIGEYFFILPGVEYITADGRDNNNNLLYTQTKNENIVGDVIFKDNKEYYGNRQIAITRGKVPYFRNFTYDSNLNTIYDNENKESFLYSCIIGNTLINSGGSLGNGLYFCDLDIFYPLTLANNDLSNISTNAKNNIINLFQVDYSAGISISSTTYTPPTNGIIISEFQSTGANSFGAFYNNTQRIAGISNGATGQFSSTFILVNKGEEYKIDMVNSNVTFYPFKNQI